MKRFLSLILAGLIGGAIVIGIDRMIFPKESETAKTIVQPAAADRSDAMTVGDRRLSVTSMPFSFSEAARKATPAVVHIRAQESAKTARERYERQKYYDPFRWFFGDDYTDPYNDHFYRRGGSGSGVIISGDGYIVTNNHVVSISEEIIVTLSDNRTFQATVVGKDPETDLAVLKIEADRLPAIELADSDEAQVGDWVLAVGNPFDYLTSTVTAGIISARGRDLDIIKSNDPSEAAIESFIQTDAAVNPGNSGGALVNAEGDLIGINTAIATPTGAYAGYSFAIPSNLMSKIVNDIIQYGEYKRVYLGVSVSDVDDELAEEFNIGVTSGVYIQEVSNGSSAAYAGLLPNDVIMTVNGRKVRSSNELVEIIGSSKIGETLEVEVLRNGKMKYIPVKLRGGM